MTQPRATPPRPRAVRATPAPEHLSAEMRAWWDHVTATYRLEPHHLRLLQLACEAWDIAAQAGAELRSEGRTFRDRFGQVRRHPSVQIEEQARRDYARLVRQLDLEGEPDPLYRRRRS